MFFIHINNYFIFEELITIAVIGRYNKKIYSIILLMINVNYFEKHIYKTVV